MFPSSSHAKLDHFQILSAFLHAYLPVSILANLFAYLQTVYYQLVYLFSLHIYLLFYLFTYYT